MTSHLSLSAIVPMAHAGSRFDQAAAELFPDYSRSRLQAWIKGGALTVDGRVVKPNIRLLGGEKLLLDAELEAEGEWQPQAIALNVIYQDESVIVIDKPPGLVVHPGAGNPEGTLLNGLLHRFPELQQVPRAGIVHRLDKDTSGLMVVARTLQAQAHLVAQLQARTVSREYHAVALGQPPKGGVIDAPIGRHPTARTKMAVVAAGKPAVTHYTRLESFSAFSYLALKLETGRTHQIRVHMAHSGYPLLGDPVYGTPASKRATPETIIFNRQALHAHRLGLIHPVSGEQLSWQSTLPSDFAALLECLRCN